MKKHLSLILILALCLTLMFTFVACDQSKDPNAGGNSGSEDNSHETALFDVIFNSNGDTSFAEYNQKVAFGEKAKVPRNNLGKVAVPTKMGHTFKFWALGSDLDKSYDFNAPITEKTSLQAIYEANKYSHTINLYEPQDEAIYNDKVSIDDEIVSTYNKKDEIFAVATTSDPADHFVYWYYYKNNDTTGDKIQLSTWADKGDSSVKSISKYSEIASQTIYAMWFSNLPDVTVTFDTDGGTDIAQISTKLFNSIDKPSEPTRNNYEFLKWSLVGTDEDGNETLTDFVFNQDISDEIEANAVGTNITLRAMWQRAYTINTASDFDALYADFADETKREELLTAQILIKNNIDFQAVSHKPIFTEEYPFDGIIDGGIYDSNDELQGPSTLQNLVLGDSNNVSLFGASSGTIKNLIFDGTKIETTKNADDEFEQSASISVVVANNSGRIENVVVKNIDMCAENNNQVVVGLVSAESNGGVLKDVTVQDVKITVKAERSSVGAVFGKSTLDRASQVEVKRASIAVEATDDGLGENGISMLRTGGFAGEVSQANLTEIEVLNSTISVKSDLNEIYAGLMAGIMTNGSILSISHTSGTVTAVGDSVYAGGFAGLLDGSITNSYSDNLTVDAKSTKTEVYAGGIAGKMSVMSNNAKIDRSYTSGSITANNAVGYVYAGGLSGNLKGTCTYSFALTSVDVTADADKALLGDLAGKKHASSSTYPNIFFSADASLKLNGVEHSVVDETENFTAFAIGKEFATDNLADEDWLVTSLKFNTKDSEGGAGIWTIVAGLPVLTEFM